MTIDGEERLCAFRARSQEYLRHDHDRVAAARFVVGAAPDLRGPALDVGTGKGLLAIELARRGMDVVSVDVSDEERDLAALLAEEAGMTSRISFVHGDAASLPYDDGHFGCVAMMDVLHHLEEPRPVLREMARVVRRGGCGILADFDEPGFELVSLIHRGEGREHPRTTTTVSLAREELSMAGFRCSLRAKGHHHDVVVMQKEDPEQEHESP